MSKIDSMSIGEGKELAALFGAAPQNDTSAWEIGKIYLIRTVTMIDVGRVVAVTPQEVVLEDAAWIADTGRFHNMITGTADPKEIEPFPEGRAIVGRGAIIDAVEHGKTYRVQK